MVESDFFRPIEGEYDSFPKVVHEVFLEHKAFMQRLLVKENVSESEFSQRCPPLMYLIDWARLNGVVTKEEDKFVVRVREEAA